MSEIISMIKSFPINKITEVYLVGSTNDYYRIILSNKSRNAVKVDLKKGLKGNFITIERSRIHIGNATQNVTPKVAKELLTKCKYLNGVIVPNKKTFDMVLNLLDIIEFQEIKQDKTNHTFVSWLHLQNGRDDLIGDVAYDILRDSKLSSFESYEKIKERIQDSTFSTSWEINTFRDHKKNGVVNPLLCLKLAKMEYDIYLKKNKLKKFAIKDKSGFVYFLKYENQDSPIKIGRAKNIKARVIQLQTSLPFDLEIIGFIETDDYFELENKFHLEFESKKLKREWFELTVDDAIQIINMNSGILTE